MGASRMRNSEGRVLFPRNEEARGEKSEFRVNYTTGFPVYPNAPSVSV